MILLNLNPPFHNVLVWFLYSFNLNAWQFSALECKWCAFFIICYQGTPTRSHNIDSLKAEKKVFIASRQLHRELAQIMRP